MSSNRLVMGSMSYKPWLDPTNSSAWVAPRRRGGAAAGGAEAQLRRDADLTHFEYWVLAMLSEAPSGPCG